MLFSSIRSNKIWSLLIIGAALIVSSNFHTDGAAALLRAVRFGLTHA